MEDNSLLMIVLAFVFGFMCSQMMKQICGGRLVEGDRVDYGEACHHFNDCKGGLICSQDFICE
tara:strand:+ start:399 stop:587 length:189 start_codon:yes stop_codon:yes gene_type:complete